MVVKHVQSPSQTFIIMYGKGKRRASENGKEEEGGGEEEQ